ncbi:MAG: hypothetical protein NTY45_07140 [Elusimicrobia bacterium]|nr:hypothetical protein [Elusimicrobiota bacterium]
MGIRTLAACIAVIAFSSAAEGAEIWFDRGVDLKQFIMAAGQGEVPSPAPARSHNGNIGLTRSCARLALGAGEGPVISKKAELASQRYIEECKPVPAGDTGLIIEHCYQRPLHEWTRTVKLLAAPRQLPPGTEEIFEVCLEGEKLELTTITAFYFYAIAREGEAEVLFTLTPPFSAPGKKEAP